MVAGREDADTLKGDAHQQASDPGQKGRRDGSGSCSAPAPTTRDQSASMRQGGAVVKKRMLGSEGLVVAERYCDLSSVGL